MILLIGKVLLLKLRKKQRGTEALSFYVVEGITSTHTYFFLYFNL